MPDVNNAGSEAQKQWRAIAVTTLLCVLPVANPVFEWLRTFIPLAPFYFSVSLGRKIGRHICLIAFVIAGLVSLLAKDIGNVIFPLTLFPVGFLMAWAMEKRKTVAWTGLTATLLVLLGWVLGGLLFWQTTGNNPYVEGLNAMDQAFADMAAMYKTSGDFPPDVVADIERGFDQARQKLPGIFPALLIMSAIIISWLNLALGNRLLGRYAPDKAVWPPYRFWRLPENLVWLLILAGILTILPVASLKMFGINGLLILGCIYFLQGLAVLFAMLVRWDAPKPIRFFIYFFIFIQTYSVVLLAFLGILDVWKDLGKIYKEEEKP